MFFGRRLSNNIQNRLSIDETKIKIIYGKLNVGQFAICQRHVFLW